MPLVSLGPKMGLAVTIVTTTALIVGIVSLFAYAIKPQSFNADMVGRTFTHVILPIALPLAFLVILGMYNPKFCAKVIFTTALFFIFMAAFGGFGQV